MHLLQRFFKKEIKVCRAIISLRKEAEKRDSN